MSDIKSKYEGCKIDSFENEGYIWELYDIPYDDGRTICNYTVIQSVAGHDNALYGVDDAKYLNELRDLI